MLVTVRRIDVVIKVILHARAAGVTNLLYVTQLWATDNTFILPPDILIFVDGTIWLLVLSTCSAEVQENIWIVTEFFFDLWEKGQII